MDLLSLIMKCYYVPFPMFLLDLQMTVGTFLGVFFLLCRVSLALWNSLPSYSVIAFKNALKIVLSFLIAVFYFYFRVPLTLAVLLLGTCTLYAMQQMMFHKKKNISHGLCALILHFTSKHCSTELLNPVQYHSVLFCLLTLVPQRCTFA